MDYVNFLKSYGAIILESIAILLTIVVMIIKKRPLMEIVDKSGLSTLIKLVKDAEKLFGAGQGDKKLEFVIENYAHEMGITRSYAFDNAIEYLINSILDTPERKEKKK